MNKTAYSLLFGIIALCCSCNSASKEKKEKPSSNINVYIDSVSAINTTKKIIIKDSATIMMKSWPINDFIVKCPKDYLSELKFNIKGVREEWKGVSNPFVAKYKGNDFGDYHHINFEDSNGKRYDFGFGNNDFKHLSLFDEELNDNPKYMGKSFQIFWEWKISSFPCCSGEYELVETYQPSIIKIELAEGNP